MISTSARADRLRATISLALGPVGAVCVAAAMGSPGPSGTRVHHHEATVATAMIAITASRPDFEGLREVMDTLSDGMRGGDNHRRPSMPEDF